MLVRQRVCCFVAFYSEVLQYSIVMYELAMHRLDLSGTYSNGRDAWTILYVLRWQYSISDDHG